MPQNAVYRRALQRAAQLSGGPELLAVRLAVPVPQLKDWLAGREPCPGEVFLTVVDLLVDADLSSIRPGAGAADAPRKPSAEG